MCFTHVSFFHEFWVALSALWDRLTCNPSTYMQSKHTFQFLHFFLKSLPEDLQMSHFLSICWPNMWFLCEKVGSKNCFKKGAPPDSKESLLTGQEAPGEAASRARCTNKKQLFEQQLKHCFRFLQKKVDWAENWCEKMTGLLNCSPKNWMDCWLLKTKASVERQC